MFVHTDNSHVHTWGENQLLGAIDIQENYQYVNMLTLASSEVSVVVAVVALIEEGQNPFKLATKPF